MKLKGKKIAFLGDSITEEVGVQNLENLYWKRLERNTGAICYGYGISGTAIAAQKIYIEDCEKYFSTRVDKMIPDADVIVVFGGTNDFGHGDAPLGKVTDRTDYTFCGAFSGLLEKLINRYPDAQIVVLTSLHRDGENFIGPNELNIRREHTLKDYVDSVIEVCGEYSVPVLDLYRTSGIQPAIPVMKERYMPDGLHPNDLGHERIAKRLQGFLESL